MTKKRMINDGCDEIMKQNLRFAKIRLKNMIDECCRNFDVDADED